MLAAKLVQAEGSAPPRDLRMWPPASIQLDTRLKGDTIYCKQPCGCLEELLPAKLSTRANVFFICFVSRLCNAFCETHKKISGPYLAYHKGSHRGMGNDN